LAALLGSCQISTGHHDVEVADAVAQQFLRTAVSGDHESAADMCGGRMYLQFAKMTREQLLQFLEQQFSNLDLPKELKYGNLIIPSEKLDETNIGFTYLGETRGSPISIDVLSIANPAGDVRLIIGLFLRRIDR
jgi:hypothetical protein